MKHYMLPITLVAVIGSLALSPCFAQAQKKKTQDGPHRIGLIDMAYIFKKYQKFQDQRADLKKEIQNSDAKAKQMVAQLQELKQKVDDPKFEKSSPQKKQWRQQLIELTAKYQSYRQEEQQRFLEKEAQIYKTIYLEVTDAVRVYAQYYDYTLILRWNSKGVADATDAKTILASMNKQVIYVRDGLDITQVILDYLNDQYRKSLKNTRSANNRNPQQRN